MKSQLNLKELERKAFRSFYQDGIWDIFFGLMMLAMYTFTVLNNYDNKALRVFGLLFLEIFAVMFLIYGKKIFTVPRLGSVKFGKKRTKRLLYIAGVNLFSLAVLATLVYVQNANPETFSASRAEIITSVGMGVWIAFITSVMAYFLEFNRLYLYALIYGATFASVLLLDIPILFLVASVLILIPGLVIFTRFLRQVKPVQGS